MSMSTAKLDPAEDHYIIGYGSIINNSSRQMTLSKVIPNYNEQVDAVAVVLSVKFGYKREWCYRSSTGFTALGLMKCSSADSPSSTEEEIDPYDGINGVLFRVPNLDSLHAFDQREKGYYRVLVPFHYILVLESLGDPPTQSYAKAISKELYQKKIWVYIPEPCNSLYPDENYPILQTYVDICFRGCLQWGGEEFAIEFLRSTSGWSNFYLNDAPMSRRPWLHRPDYMIIDKCLQQLSAHVCYTERRHPEDYASQHLTSLRGIWNVPPRSKVFTGREVVLEAVHDTLFKSKENTGLSILGLIGIGGVGKTQVSIEYCYQQFGTSYGFVAWLRGENAASILADFRQLAQDLGIIKSSRKKTKSRLSKIIEECDRPSCKSVKDSLADDDDDENHPSERFNNIHSTPSNHSSSDDDIDDETIVELVKRKLSKCRCKWLIVFDNVEDPNIIQSYLPRAQHIGHEDLVKDAFQNPIDSGNTNNNSSSNDDMKSTWLPSQQNEASSNNCYHVGCSGHILMTCRVAIGDNFSFDKILNSSISTLPIECFSRSDSVKYLETTLYQHEQSLGMNNSVTVNSISKDDRRAMSMIAKRMGYLPLALGMAAAYMLRCDVPPSEYIHRLQTTTSSVTPKNSSASSTVHDSITSSLHITLERLERESNACVKVLLRLGFLSSDGITQAMIRALLSTVHYHHDGPQVVDVDPLESQVKPIHSEDSTSMRSIPVLALTTAAAVITPVSFLLSKYSNLPKGRLVIGSLAFGFIAAATVAALAYLKSRPTVKSKPVLSLSLQPSSQSSTTLVDDVERMSSTSNDENTSLLYEADRVWELLKQFLLLHVRGPRHQRIGSIHRLQQAALRHITASTNIHPSDYTLCCFEQCIWVIHKLWRFDAVDTNTWNDCGLYFDHMQSLLTHFKEYNMILRRSIARLFSNLLTEGSAYASIVLSRFDIAQMVLENALEIQNQIITSPMDGRDFLYSMLQQVDQNNTDRWKAIADYYMAHHLSQDLSVIESLISEHSSTLRNFGKILRIRSQYRESGLVLTEALVLRQRLIPESTINEMNTISLECNLDMSMLENKGKLLTMMDAKSFECSLSTRVHLHEIADILHELGVLNLRRNVLHAAEKFLMKSYMIKQIIMSNIHPHDQICCKSATAETSIAATLHQLAIVAIADHRKVYAEKLLQHALDEEKRSYVGYRVGNGNLSQSTSKKGLISRAATLQQLGRVAVRRGKLEEAKQNLHEALKLYEEVYGALHSKRHINVAAVHYQLGNCYSALHEYENASHHFSIALNIREFVYGDGSNDHDSNNHSGDGDHIEIVLSLHALARSELEKGQFNISESLFQREYEMTTRLLLRWYQNQSIYLNSLMQEKIPQKFFNSYSLSSDDMTSSSSTLVEMISSKHNSTVSHVDNLIDYRLNCQNENQPVVSNISKLSNCIFITENDNDLLNLFNYVDDIELELKERNRNRHTIIRSLLFSLYSLRNIRKKHHDLTMSQYYIRKAQYMKRIHSKYDNMKSISDMLKLSNSLAMITAAMTTSDDDLTLFENFESMLALNETVSSSTASLSILMKENSSTLFSYDSFYDKKLDGTEIIGSGYDRVSDPIYSLCQIASDIRFKIRSLTKKILSQLKIVNDNNLKQEQFSISQQSVSLPNENSNNSISNCKNVTKKCISETKIGELLQNLQILPHQLQQSLQIKNDEIVKSLDNHNDYDSYHVFHNHLVAYLVKFHHMIEKFHQNFCCTQNENRYHSLPQQQQQQQQQQNNSIVKNYPKIQSLSTDDIQLLSNLVTGMFALCDEMRNYLSCEYGITIEDSKHKRK